METATVIIPPVFHRELSGPFDAMQSDRDKKLLTAWFVETLNRNNHQQAELAQLLDIKPAAISKIKNGTRSIQAHELLRLAEITGRALPRLSETNNPHDDNRDPLYTKAFEHVEEIENLSGNKMHPDRFLEEVYTVYNKLLHRAQAITRNNS